MPINKSYIFKEASRFISISARRNLLQNWAQDKHSSAWMGWGWRGQENNSAKHKMACSGRLSTGKKYKENHVNI